MLRSFVVEHRPYHCECDGFCDGGYGSVFRSYQNALQACGIHSIPSMAELVETLGDRRLKLEDLQPLLAQRVVISTRQSTDLADISGFLSDGSVVIVDDGANNCFCIKKLKTSAVLLMDPRTMTPKDVERTFTMESLLVFLREITLSWSIVALQRLQPPRAPWWCRV